MGGGVVWGVWRRRYRPRATSPAPRDLACVPRACVPSAQTLIFLFACCFACASLFSYFNCPPPPLPRSAHLASHHISPPHAPIPRPRPSILPPPPVPELPPMYPVSHLQQRGRPPPLRPPHGRTRGPIVRSRPLLARGVGASRGVCPPPVPPPFCLLLPLLFLPLDRPPVDRSAPGAATTALGRQTGGVGRMSGGWRPGRRPRRAALHTAADAAPAAAGSGQAQLPRPSAVGRG